MSSFSSLRRIPLTGFFILSALLARPAQAQWAHGSTILLLVRDTVAYLATDSKLSTDRGADDSGCKIICGENKVVGLSGILTARDLGFNLRDELTAALRAAPSDSIVTTLRSLQPRVAAVLRAGRTAKIVPDSLLAIGVVGCEFIGGEHVSTMVRYTVMRDGRPRFQSSLSMGNHLFCEGVTSAIEDRIPRSFGSHNPVAALDSLMHLQVTTTPASVGGATDVVSLTKHGIRWIRKKQNCPD